MCKNKSTLDVINNVCPHCSEHLLMNKKKFANHVRWCEKNPNYYEIRETLSKKIKELNRKRFGDVKQFEVECANPRCKKHFLIECKENIFNENKKYFCSDFCANSHTVSDETKEKIRNGVKEYIIKNGGFGCLSKNINFISEKKRKCENCGKEFTAKKRNQKYCCNKCYNHNKLIKYYSKKFNCNKNDIETYKTLYSIYKNQCKFTFGISEYYNEFNVELIKENGWYSASNHGNNLNGVSRDHMFSINEGFKEKIDPYLISHPANCELLPQTANSSKRSKCSISKEELIERVEKWNNKYGKYENKINYEILNKFNIIF